MDGSKIRDVEVHVIPVGSSWFQVPVCAARLPPVRRE